MNMWEWDVTNRALVSAAGRTQVDGTGRCRTERFQDTELVEVVAGYNLHELRGRRRKQLLVEAWKNNFLWACDKIKDQKSARKFRM